MIKDALSSAHLELLYATLMRTNLKMGTNESIVEKRDRNTRNDDSLIYGNLRIGYGVGLLRSLQVGYHTSAPRRDANPRKIRDSEI